MADFCVAKLEELPYIEIYHPKQGAKGPAIAFNVKGVHPHDVATILDYHGVAIRAGHHCTQPLHRYLGQNSTNRASFAFYNTKKEIDIFVAALEDVKDIMQIDI